LHMVIYALIIAVSGTHHSEKEGNSSAF